MKVDTKKVNELTPNLNEINEIDLGFSLVSSLNANLYKAIKVKEPFKMKVGYLNKEIVVDEVFICTTETKKHNLFFKKEDLTYGIAVSKESGEVSFFNYNGMLVSIIRTDKSIENKISFFEIPNEISNNFKQEFIYNGRVDKSIRFIYREFIDNLARPAFTQELQYDLSDSKVLGFKGMRIEVIEATNTKIRYKVLNHFTQ